MWRRYLVKLAREKKEISNKPRNLLPGTRLIYDISVHWTWRQENPVAHFVLKQARLNLF